MRYLLTFIFLLSWTSTHAQSSKSELPSTKELSDGIIALNCVDANVDVDVRDRWSETIVITKMDGQFQIVNAPNPVEVTETRNGFVLKGLKDAPSIGFIKENGGNWSIDFLSETISLKGVCTDEKPFVKTIISAIAPKVFENANSLSFIVEALALQLNAEREKAEETLTLLAAAQNAENNLSEVTAAALTEVEKTNALLAVSQAELKKVKDISSESQRQAVVLSQEVAALRSQISSLQITLGQIESEDEANRIEIVNLGKSLNNALARAASAEKKNAQFLAAKNERLEAEAAILKAKAESLEGYKSKFFGEVRKSLEGQKGVKLVGDRFVFSSEVLFASAEAELTDQGKNEIAEIAALIQGATSKMPNTIDWILQVDGHTDNQAISSGAQFADNWELSQARALSVVQFLVKEQNMDPARLSANGFAQFQPVNADNTSEARAQNRRIELKLTEKQSYTD